MYVLVKCVSLVYVLGTVDCPTRLALYYVTVPPSPYPLTTFPAYTYTYTCTYTYTYTYTYTVR